MKIILIAAMTQQRVIGNNNKMLWHLPRDLKHFYQETVGKSIIMGRKTLEDLGTPLPKRRNIIITRQQNLSIPGCEIVHSLEEALQLTRNESEVIIGGGGEIYSLALPLATDLDLTIIEADIPGNAYFPVFNKTEWQLISREEHLPDEKHAYAFAFEHYQRK